MPGSKSATKGINKVTKRLSDGSTRIYYYDRLTGKRINGELGTSEFAKSLKQVRRTRPTYKPKSPPVSAWKVICDRYERQSEFLSLAPKTQHDRIRMMIEIVDRFGFMTFNDLDSSKVRSDFYDFREAMSRTPSKADKICGMMALLLEFAYDNGLIQYNHARRIKRLSKHDSRKNIIVTENMENLILNVSNSYLANAYKLATMTAIRQSDMCRLTRDNLKNGWLHYIPSKTAKTTRAEVWLPVFNLPPLQAVINDLLEQPDLDRRLLLWNGERGLRPLEPGNLDRVWRIARRDALGSNIDLHWHDLRGTAITRLSEAGCTDTEIASISGHISMEENSLRSGNSLKKYQASTQRLAFNAFAKFARFLAEPRLQWTPSATEI